MTMETSYTYYLTPTGLRYNFKEGDDHFYLSEEGWGLPPIRYLKTRGPDQHGESIVGYRLEPRIIQFTHHVNTCSLSNYYSQRAELVDIFRPNRNSGTNYNPGQLVKVMPNGSKRQLDVFLQEGPKFNAHSQDRWEEWTIHEVFQFYAPNPILYDPTSTMVENTAPATDNHLIFPMTFRGVTGDYEYDDLQFVTGAFTKSFSITYEGNWLSYPFLSMLGPCSSPTLFNETTGEKITLNHTIVPGELLQVYLDYGNKRVYSMPAPPYTPPGIEMVGIVSDDSDLSTFHLAASPEAAGGVNNFVWSGTGATEGVTMIQITYYRRYIGL